MPFGDAAYARVVLSGHRSPPYRSSPTVIDLGRAVREHGVLLRLGDARDLLEDRVAHGRVARDDGHAEDRALQHVLLADLGDRDVEARAHPIAELLHDAPLVLERPRVRDVEREPQDADEHRLGAELRASA